MKIAYIHSFMFTEVTWKSAARSLASEGITLSFFSQNANTAKKKKKFNPDIVIGDLASALPGYAEVIEQCMETDRRVAISAEAIPDFSTFADEEIACFSKYLEKISLVNYENGIRYLASSGGGDHSPEPVESVNTHGVYPDDGFRFNAGVQDEFDFFLF